MEFEKPIVNLKEKIKELKAFTENSEIDLKDEIRTLEERLAKLEEDIYGNLKPGTGCRWQDIQIVLLH